MKTRILQLFILMLLGLGVQAQVTNSSLTGTVKDKSGAIIGATVQAVHLPTNTLMVQLQMKMEFTPL